MYQMSFRLLVFKLKNINIPFCELIWNLLFWYLYLIQDRKELIDQGILQHLNPDRQSKLHLDFVQEQLYVLFVELLSKPLLLD